MRYWEQEQPIVVSTSRNVLKYFREAGKLQVSHPSWTNDKGEERPGKTVTLDIAALSENGGAMTVMCDILAEITGELEK